MSGSGNGSERGPAPPYLAFQTLKSFLATAKANGLPNRIDPSVLTNLSGSVRGQLITALKFFELIDQDGRPNAKLNNLVEAYETPDVWDGLLRHLLEEKYAPLFALNLKSATPNEFDRAFASHFSGEGETIRKGKTFFLNAAGEAKVEISPYIMRNKKPRNVATRARKNATAKAAPAAPEMRGGVPGAGTQPGGHADRNRTLPVLVKALVDMLPEEGEEWTLEAAEEWLQTAAHNFRYAYKLPRILEIEIKPRGSPQA